MRRLGALVCVMSLLSGCSFVATWPGPRPVLPEDAPDGKPGWTSCASPAFPVLDLVGGSLLAGALAAPEAFRVCDYDDNGECASGRRQTLYAAGATLAVFTAAALYGAIATSVCYARI